MKANKTKFRVPKPTGVNSRKCSIVLAEMLGVLCLVLASSAFGQFSDAQRTSNAERDHYSGSMWISNSAALNNGGTLIYTNATFPTNTGPLAYLQQSGWLSGDYWWGVGVLDYGADGAVINNTGTIQGIISGYGQAQAVGIVSLQNLIVTNWGTIDGQVLNHDGEAAGLWTDSQSTTVYNNGTISARSKFSAVAVNTQNRVHFVNNGTIQAVADLGTEGGDANHAYADAFTLGSDIGIPMYLENNGQIFAKATSLTGTNEPRCCYCWGNGPVVWKNTGLIYSENLGPYGQAEGFYYGAQSDDIWLYNSGTFTNVSSSGDGYAVWLENDGDKGNVGINNSGLITSPNTSILLLTGHWGPPSVSRTYYTNSGTFLGGQMRLYGFPVSVYEAGQIHATMFGINDFSDVHIMGLPTIDPTIACSGTNSTLEFNLVGTLQKVNGTTVTGTNLSAFNPGQSGSIVVSGKTYSWSGAGSVSGAINPAGSVPSPWQQQDIGSVGVAGGAVYCGGMFTVLASGSLIGGTADAFHYVYQAANNPCSISAPVSLPQSANAGAQAGVMIRDSLNANAANAFVGLTATNIVTFQYRSSDGGATSSNSVTVASPVHWVKLAQSGSTLTGYYSVDGTNWTQLGTATVSVGAANYMGLAFCNGNNSSNGLATFYGPTCSGAALLPSVPAGLAATAGVEQVTLNWQSSSNTASYIIGRSTVSGGPYTTIGTAAGTNYTDRTVAGRTPYYYVVTAVTPGSQSGTSAQASATPTANVPLPWVAQDFGPVGVVGAEGYTNGVFTVSGAGADIDNDESYNVGRQDTCRFVYQTNSGNCTIRARVTSIQNTDSQAKAGVMIRDGLSADAANVFVGMTPGNGVVLTYRSTNGAIGTMAFSVTNLPVPCWVALARNGSNFSGYYSADGNTWTQFGTATVAMTDPEYVGMAVVSRHNWSLCTATFDNVNTPGVPSPTNLTATAVASNGSVNLAWDAVTGATGYNVKRATTSDGPYIIIAAGLAANNFSDTNVAVGVTYYYAVTAIAGGLQSLNSLEVSSVILGPTATTLSVADSYVRDGGSAGNNYGTATDLDVKASGSGFNRIIYLKFNVQALTNISSLQLNLMPYWVTNSGTTYTDVVNNLTFASVTNDSWTETGITWNNQPGNSGTILASLNTDYQIGVPVTVSFPPSAAMTQATNDGYLSIEVYAASSTVGLIQFCSKEYPTIGWRPFLQYGQTPPPPSAPAGLSAMAATNQINLTWLASANATSYNVMRSLTSGGDYTIVAKGVAATNFNDTGLATGTTYYYVVSAVSALGEGLDSAEASATTFAPGIDVVLTANDANSTTATSFNSAGNWSNLAAPAATNRYFTSSFLLRSPANSTDYSFGGSSLSIDTYTPGAAGRFLMKGPGGATITVTNLILNGGLVDYADSATAIETLSGKITLNGGTLSYLGAFSSSSLLVTAPISGAGNLQIGGSNINGGTDTGFVALSGASIYSGSTTVAGGTLLVNGTAPNTSVTVLTNGVLGGTGSVGGPVTVQGTLAPGILGRGAQTNTIGMLTVSGTASVSGTVVMKINRDVSPNSDELAAPSVTINSGATLTVTNIGSTNLVAGDTFTLFSTAVSGSFSMTSLPPLPSQNLVWTNKLTVNGTIAVIPVTINPPPAPTGLTATAGNAQVALNWTPSSGATGYNVKRATVSGGPYTTVAGGINSTSYLDTGLANGTTYYYVVSALNAGGESANSSQASATPLAPPAAPAGLTANVGGCVTYLSWGAASGATTYNVKRAIVSGGPYTVVQSGIATTAFTDNAVTNGTTYYYVVSGVNANGEGPNSAEVSASPLPLVPSPWQTGDIGSVGVTGSAGYNNGIFTIYGSGADIFGTADAFRYVYQSASGNCSIVGRVTAVQNTDPWAKAGVMIRETSAAGATHASVFVTPGNGIVFDQRTSTGSASVQTNIAGLAAPYWVQVVRSGNTFAASFSSDGVTWTNIGSATITMATNIYIGMAVTSRTNGILSGSSLDGVTAAPSLPPAVPTGISATAGNAQVALSWNGSSFATSYNVKRATVDGGPYTALTNVITINYTDTTAVNGTTYYYVVSAVNTAGESANSSQVSAMPGAPAPAAPTGLTAVAQQTKGKIKLTWTQSTSSNISSNSVYRATVNGGPYTKVTTIAASTAYTDTGRTSGATYYYVVTAINSSNLESAYSNQASATSK